MSLFRTQDRVFVESIHALTYANPFLPERVDLERRALGPAFTQHGRHWSHDPRSEHEDPNLERMTERSWALAQAARESLRSDAPGDGDLLLYESLVLFALYHRYRAALTGMIDQHRTTVPFAAEYDRFARELLAPGGRTLPGGHDPDHALAFFFQLRRAFHQIFGSIIGTSAPAMRLRAAVWQSVFTHDLGRYVRALFDRMSDISTLVTGPSGTGKELVARAIGLSGWIPYDASRRSFALTSDETFHAVNLTALSPTLIESELFGHRRGAFTGAVSDRTGWFEVAGSRGAVFLDEIGEIALSIQVKLLRVLQTRTFQRLGDTRTRVFSGRVLSATNRDLGAELAAGRFREDLYYRLCSDRIVTPALAEQLADDPGELPRLVDFVSQRLVGEEGEGLAREVLAWINQELGHDYTWPGNFRELEQCVRSVLVRGSYRPTGARARQPVGALLEDVQQGALSADELLRRYCTLVYAQVGSYEGAARRLGLDRRTVRARVDPTLLAALRSAGHDPPPDALR